MLFEQNPTRVDVAYTLLTDPSKQMILTVQNENGSWTLPGGKREPNESLIQAAIREAKEETGLDIMVDGLVFVRERFTIDHVLFYTFYGQITGGTLLNGDGIEILQVKWMSPSEVQQKMPWYRKQDLLHPQTISYFVE